MRIDKILTQYRNDFTAILVCEHCGHERKLMTGYDDANYHRNVIPKMLCVACFKDRAGNTKAAKTLAEGHTPS